MSDIKRLPKSRTSCPLKPWLVDFIFNYDSSQNATANAVKILENINKDENGNVMKLVTDGSVHIKANITQQSIQTCIEENEDDMPPWDKALILMRKYSLTFHPKTELENCEFVLIVDEFKLWDLQTGFDFKKTLHPCSNIAKVKMKLREYWQKWRDSIVPVNDEPSIGDSMGSQLLSLLAEMGQQTLPEDSLPDQAQSVEDGNPALNTDILQNSTDYQPVLNGPTLIAEEQSVSESQRQPFLQYIADNKHHQDISHPKTPESQSQQYEDYEFSSPSEVSLEFSCESSEEDNTENNAELKPSKNQVTDIPYKNTPCDKPETHELASKNVETSICHEEENSEGCENHRILVSCGQESVSNPCESENMPVQSSYKSRCNNSNDFLQSYVNYLKNCSTSFRNAQPKVCSTENSNINDIENSLLLQTIEDFDEKSLLDTSDSQIYTNLVENDYDSLQWWSSTDENACLSDEDKTLEGSKLECQITSQQPINTPTSSEISKNNHTTKCLKSTEHNATPERDKTQNGDNTSESDKRLQCDKIREERDKTSELNISENLNSISNIEDNVSGTQPFSIHLPDENFESIGNTTCVGLKYKQNLSELRDGDNELSGMQPLISQPERNSDSVSTREPSDEMFFNSNSNNSCEVFQRSESSCYEISEFESKNSTDSNKSNVKDLKCDTPKCQNSSIIYQSTQKTDSKKDVPLFHLSPIKHTEVLSNTSRDKAKESLENLVFDTEYEEELRLRDMAKVDPKNNVRLNKTSPSKSGHGSNTSLVQNKSNQLGTSNGASESDKWEILSRKSVCTSDKASSSDLLLIQAAQSAEKHLPQRILEKHSNSPKCQNLQSSEYVRNENLRISKKHGPKTLNFQQITEISDKDSETVNQPRKNSSEKPVSDSNSLESVIIINSSESSSNSDESRYSQNVISFHTSPSKKHPSHVSKKKTKVKVLAHDTEPNIVEESQDIPTSEVNNSILNHSTKCKTTANLPHHSPILVSDLSDTSSDEREEPNRPKNQKLKDVLYERLSKRKRKLSMDKSASVEIGEPSSKRTRCVPEQEVICLDVQVSQTQNMPKQNKSHKHTNQPSTSKTVLNVTPGALNNTDVKFNNNVISHNLFSEQIDECMEILSRNNDIIGQNQSLSRIKMKPCDQSNSSCSSPIVKDHQPNPSSSGSCGNGNQQIPSSSGSCGNCNQPIPSSSGSCGNGNQPIPSSSGSCGNGNQPNSSSSGNGHQPIPSSSGNGHQPISSSSGNGHQPNPSSSGNVHQPNSSSSRSSVESGQLKSRSCLSLVHGDQPRSSSSSIEMLPAHTDLWDKSDQPSTSKGLRNDSRLPECNNRNIPKCFEELFEEDQQADLQKKLLNFKITSTKLQHIHKYFHK